MDGRASILEHTAQVYLNENTSIPPKVNSIINPHKTPPTMANVKYRVKEFTPTANQSGSHSFYAEAVVDNVIDNKALAKKIEARGISRAAEIKSILE